MCIRFFSCLVLLLSLSMFLFSTSWNFLLCSQTPGNIAIHNSEPISQITYHTQRFYFCPFQHPSINIRCDFVFEILRLIFLNLKGCPDLCEILRNLRYPRCFINIKCFPLLKKINGNFTFMDKKGEGVCHLGNRFLV